MAGHQWSSVVISDHQWSSVAGHQWSSVLSSGPMIGVVGSSQSPQHAWNPLRYRLVPDAMCRLHDTCRCTLAAAAAASDPSALPRRARAGAQHDAAPANQPTGHPLNTTRSEAPSGDGHPLNTTRSEALSGDAHPLNTTRSEALSGDAHWLGYPEIFPFMAYELGLDSVQIGPIAGGAYRGDASVNGQGDASVNGQGDASVSGSAASASADSAASGSAAKAGSAGSAGPAAGAGGQLGQLGPAARAGGHGSRRARPLSSAARPLPPPGTPGWRAEIVITTAACMGAPIRRMPKLGWRTCLDGLVEVRAGYLGDDASGSTVAGHPNMHHNRGRRESGDGTRRQVGAVAGAGRACDCDQTARLLNCDGAHWSCRPYCRPPHQSDSARRQMLCSRGDCAGCQFCAAPRGVLPV